MSASPQLVAAIALRGKVAQDLAAQTAALELLQTRATEAETAAPTELASYVDGGAVADDDVQAQVRRVSAKVAHARRALTQADREIQLQRRAATIGFVQAQAPQLAKLRKQFVAAAAQVVAAFDALDAWERTAESAGLDPLILIETLETTALSGPRCGRSELAQHLRDWLKRNN